MNKPPQPITGPTSVPNPAPSPGLTQAAYGPGQPPSLVFATPPPPQMNSAPQPRQFAAGPRTLHQQGGYRALQGYYSNRPAMATTAPRVQTSGGPRPVGPTHVYPPSSQMMMIPQQQLSFASSPQGYFIPPGQYRAPYMPPTQQYPVTSGTAGFYAGTSPAEYPGYEPSLAARERRGGGGRGGGRENGRLSLHGAPLTSQRYPAGAYYPAQTPYSPSVQTAQVMINPAQQQQPAPSPQQPPAPPQGPPKRERKPIRIRDPTRGGRDITEEIMSGGRSTSTPTPPQANITEAGPAQTNGEVIPPVTTVTRRDDNVEHVGSVETPPPPPTANTEPVCEAAQEADNQNLPAAELEPVAPDLAPEVPTQLIEEQPAPALLPPTTAASVVEVDEVDTNVGDTVDSPVCPSPSTAQEEEPQAPSALCEKTLENQQVEEMRVVEEKEEPMAIATVEPVAEVAEVLPRVGTETEDISKKMTTEAPQPPVLVQEPAASPTQNATPKPEPQSTPPEPAEPPLSNGLPQDVEELCEEDTTTCDQPDASQSQESTPVSKTAVPVVEEVEVEKELVVEDKKQQVVKVAKSEEVPPVSVNSPTEESAMQAATSVPKKRRNMKEINKKEAIGDLLDAFTEEQDAKPASEPSSTQADTLPVAPSEPPAEVADETWEEKEDKQNAEPESKSDSTDKKYQYKEEQWKPINPEEKKRYDRTFLLGFQFISASLNKPEGLPVINDVVLDKVNKTPLRPADPVRMMNVGTDFTPSYLGNLGSRSVGGPRGPPPGPRRSQQGQRKEPRKIITSMSLNDDVQLNKAEKAWKPTSKKPSRGRSDEDVPAATDEELTPEQSQTKEILKRLRSILNKLTPQKFQELMNQVKELTIDTEERLKGAIDLIFEKAILEPSFSVAYANMCRCLSALKVPTTDKPGLIVTFRKLLLNRCQKEFEKDQDDDEFLEKKQKEMEAAKDEEERERMRLELEEARDKARRRSMGNIKFIGELFKLKMLTEAIMHDCVMKLLKNHDEESLECLCRLLSTIGKDLDFEKAKPRMDQYFNQMEKIIKEKKTSSRIRFMLQDVLDLRKCNWVPRRGDQGPKTIDQIHKDAEMEEHREQIKVQQQLMSKKDTGGGGGGRMGGGMGGRGPHTPGGRGSQPQDEGWNTVPITKRPYDTARLKITKPDNPDLNNQRLAPSGKSWGKGSSGGMGVKTATGEQDSGRPTTSTVNRFGALQQSSSLSSDTDRRAPQRSSSSRERGGDRDRGDRDRFDRDDRSSQRQITKRSFSRETEERSGRGSDSKPSNEPVRRVASMTDSRDRGSRDRGSRDRGSRDRASRDRGPSKDLPAKRESVPAPPSLPKPTLTEVEVEKKSTAIIEEYLQINDLKEALLCVEELNSTALLYVFVRQGVESTLERSTSAREHMGMLLHKLIKAGTMPVLQYLKGLLEILEIAEDMAIDIPHIWLYLAEILTPMLLEGGMPMGQLFREISKPLLPQGKASILLVQILHLLCKGLTRSKVGAMWKEAGLNWSDFLSKNEDANKFVTEQKVEFTTGEEQETKESTKKSLSGEELRQELDRLLRDKASDQRIKDWVEANLDEQQSSSNQFVRALMTTVCQLAIRGDPYKVDVPLIDNRATLLQGFLSDEQKELQALYALQALMVQLEQPANLLRMFFDVLYDADVIKEQAFYKWESSKDAAEQNGKGVALKSVTGFFAWLREPEEESDKD
ncbi:eukaryotic translation initiation factor 4 gamma 1a isoform X11 [Phyllopteryx taeniolatus]|uniref:eukaryotic translation initiation factor 4 gamma 1a isoform X11 n=1 Tax=Phyllopteryx taeniolatus TaxID=161469 RepID=UPI002AD3D346|nr:eukaryotic translation initiation factor 4 gamma 1a isoform X11 [Phyllopteryx taeniolatus]